MVAEFTQRPARRRILGFGMALAAAPAFAQAPRFPSRPVKLIVPSPPGGGPDHVARLTAAIWSQRFGHQVVVENIAGASGQVATQNVVRSAPDGHTLLFSPPTPITVADNFEPKPAYDARRDLVTAGLVGRNPALLVINSNVKANTLKELVALAKAEPKKLNFGSPGLGNTLHLIAEIVCAKAGMQMTHVPYKGSGPAVVGLLGGEVQMLVQSAESVKEHVKSGRLRALATLESSRLEAFPDVPTLAEAGLANLDIVNWYGVFMPTATPKEIQDFLEREILALAKDATFVRRMKEMSFDPMVLSAQDFNRMMAAERPQWTAAIKAAGIDTKKN
jgi:tripartite-type tricarboxylate transporter receptor subunit TctC